MYATGFAAPQNGPVLNIIENYDFLAKIKMHTTYYYFYTFREQKI